MNKLMQRASPWKQTSVIVVVAISILALVSLFTFPSRTVPSILGGKKGIMHIVMFEYKEGAKPAEVQEANARMLALKDKCVHPITKTPYVRMGMGGRQNSPEGLTGGVQYIFLIEFANEEDRAYYLDKDPVHVAFKSSIGGVVEKVQVVDFVPGVF
ncbi:hypothetical protein BUE80_DR011591 [Diplocarpon rosae]|nr:hypothetical protein BUE80_DR011591 [Diplocarpon rosae]